MSNACETAPCFLPTSYRERLTFRVAKGILLCEKSAIRQTDQPERVFINSNTATWPSGGVCFLLE